MSDENDSWLEGIGVDVEGILGSVEDTAAGVCDSVGSAASSVYDAASGACDAVEGAVGSACDAAAGAYGAASSAVENAYDGAAGAVGGVYDAAGSAASGIGGALADAYDSASGSAAGVYDAAAGAVGSAYDSAAGAVGTAYQGVYDAASETCDAASGAASDAYDGITDAASGAADAVSDAANWAAGFLASAADGTAGILDDASALLDGVSGVGEMKLTADLMSQQIDSAHQYLSFHGFLATWTNGSGANIDNYEPVIDGRPTTIDMVVLAVMAEVPYYPWQNPARDFKALIEQRFKKMALEAMKKADQRLKLDPNSVTADASVSREEAQKDLTAFFKRVLDAQGGQTLRITEPVRLAGNAISRGLPGSDLAVATYLQGKSLPGSPAALAQGVAQLLPPQIPRANVENLSRIPVRETGNTRPQTLSEALAGALSKELERIIKPLPASWQAAIRKGAADALASGLVAFVKHAMNDSPLDDDAKERITSLVEAALKQKANEPMDRKANTSGSPHAHQAPPSTAPTHPDIPPEEKLKD